MNDDRNRFRRWVQRFWVNNRERQLTNIPAPADSPHAHAKGPDQLHVLIFGAGPAVGWGVRSHELALPGGTARAVSALSGRGCEVDLLADPDMDVAEASARANSIAGDRYDTVAVVLGMNDAVALTPVAAWEQHLRLVIAHLSSGGARQIVICGIQPPQSIPIFGGARGRLASRHADELNRASAAICEMDPRATFVPLTAPRPDESARYRAPAAYSDWGEAIARAICLAISGRTSDEEATSRAPRPQTASSEAARQEQVNGFDFASAVDDPRLAQLVMSARRSYGADAAMFTVIDRERQLTVARSGSTPDNLPREHSICHHTIQSREGIVIANALTDARSSESPLVTGDPYIRFYAGYPISGPSGDMIGALCVIDTAPRTAGSVDLGLLQEIAHFVQREIWRYWTDEPETAVAIR